MSRNLTIEDMHELAQSRGGKCLSNVYINSQSNLEWQCREGHQWRARPAKVRFGSWCRICSGNIKKTIEEMRQLAEANGGKCLSEVYKSNSQPLKWKCSARGHIFNSSYTAIKKAINSGGFCPKCGKIRGAAKRRATIDEMRLIAESRSGKCLSNEYTNAHTLLEWQCIDGHIFKMKPNAVKNGHWCPDCRFYLNESKCRFILEKLTGKPFKSNKRILQGLELDGYNADINVAFEYNGIQHYKFIEFFHRTEEEFLKRLAYDIRKQKMCNDMGIHLIIISYKLRDDKELVRFIAKKLREFDILIKMEPAELTFDEFYNNSSALQELREIAIQRRGKLTSNYYHNNKTPVKWQCEFGHVWSARPNDIKNGQWCSICNGSHKLTIEEMQKIALDRGGKCLSSTYVNNRTKLLWECRNGHQWKAIPDSIKQGKWCTICRKREAASRRKLTIEEMHSIAKSRGGQCLSNEYINNQTHLLWKCTDGHVWSAKPNNIKNGTWCPNCKNRKN